MSSSAVATPAANINHQVLLILCTFFICSGPFWQVKFLSHRRRDSAKTETTGDAQNPANSSRPPRLRRRRAKRHRPQETWEALQRRRWQ